MTLVDVFNSGTLVCLVTAAAREGERTQGSANELDPGTTNYRLDFVTVDQQREAQAIDFLKKRLQANTNGKFALLVAKRSEKDLKCIAVRPDIIKPYDFDKIEVSKISRDILNIAGIEGMSSALLDTSKLMKGEKLDLMIFASVESSKYISSEIATSLKLTGHDDKPDSLEFGIVELVESGEYKLMGKNYTHYGEVAMSKYDEFFITPKVASKYGVALKSGSTVTGASQGVASRPTSSGAPVASVSSSNQPSKTGRQLKNFTAAKPTTATAALGLVALGTTAAAFFSKESKTEVYKTREGVLYYDRPGNDKDEVVLDGQGMTVEEYQQYLRMT